MLDFQVAPTQRSGGTWFNGPKIDCGTTSVSMAHLTGFEASGKLRKEGEKLYNEIHLLDLSVLFTESQKPLSQHPEPFKRQRIQHRRSQTKHSNCLNSCTSNRLRNFTKSTKVNSKLTLKLRSLTYFSRSLNECPAIRLDCLKRKVAFSLEFQRMTTA